MYAVAHTHNLAPVEKKNQSINQLALENVYRRSLNNESWQLHQLSPTYGHLAGQVEWMLHKIQNKGKALLQSEGNKERWELQRK